MNRRLIRINPQDCVAVALSPVGKGETLTVDGITVTALADIPAGHKIALRDLRRGEPVIKYGYPIGAATRDVEKGEHVHTDNCSTLLKETGTYSYDPGAASLYLKKEEERRKLWEGRVPSIKAYMRQDGRIGIRNEIWIVPGVGCVNRPAEKIAAWANERNLAPDGGVHAWTHPFGCSQMGDDKAATKKILAALVHNPNAGGVLVLSLGCEATTPAELKEEIGEVDGSRVKFLTCQEVGDEIAEGEKLVSRISRAMKNDKRQSVPMSKLVVGFKCGGSDGLSGITANPLVGRFCDALTAMGGTAVLSEVPEMFGAEQILMNRAQDRKIFDETVAMINGFKKYFVDHHQVVYDNPSPGNKAGGITTLEDKSLGCVQKGGESVVRGVLGYGDRVKAQGLNLLYGPGNDIVSTTAEAAAGCNIVLFTTGRGTPLGCPVPTMKIATNHPLATGKADWIDFDASRVLSEDPDKVTADFIKLVARIASGEYRTKNEQNGYAEISIFKDGVFL